MKAIAGVLLFASSLASAQPITQPAQSPEPCRVVVVLAPAEVRAEIEAWVRSEPRCVRELEVRVVPARDGLYLSASDRHGHVRERVVPDAQSAAVLVVSWMADDSLGATYPAQVGPAPESAAEAATPVETELAPPATVESLDSESPFVAPRLHAKPARYLTLGAIGTVRDGDRMREPELEVGARGQLDLIGGAHWYLGIAGNIAEHRSGARVVVGAQAARGRASLRLQIGVGAEHTHDFMREHMDPSVELGLFGRFAIDRHWAAVGGPVINATDDSVSPSLFLGVQHDL